MLINFLFKLFLRPQLYVNFIIFRKENNEGRVVSGQYFVLASQPTNQPTKKPKSKETNERNNQPTNQKKKTQELNNEPKNQPS